ncbi:conserved exported hypothetical protein [Bacillus sp. 349Y]|nr:conserved exported hypothetical protein [Bacillus sp. 349Y]
MKTERMSIKEFMNREGKPSLSKSVMKFGAALPLAILPMTTTTAQAATPQSVPVVATMNADQIYDKILVAFEPVTTLIQALAYPVASVVVLFGAIMVLISQKEKGFALMSNAGLGVILVNLMPLLLNILVQIMKGF